ncbi:nucleic-acid-binding protein from mobile element jockey [Plakobranchus ocellatus]|uniref:Nucleic-acid-binding protein from mobile element jockey n=1 Tax=Plakobranchus ocellatus TaxID=259542 RepID=A0AAV3YZJ8_9GAST|nr:nucleic-acid-binding protein from mobile element jockey [Plakobranchus ocellatus]
MAGSAKRLNVSLGASCLFDFSVLRLAGISVSAAPWGLGAGESFWAFFPFGRGRKGTSAAILGERCWLRSKLGLNGTGISTG